MRRSGCDRAPDASAPHRSAVPGSCDVSSTRAWPGHLLLGRRPASSATTQATGPVKSSSGPRLMTRNDVTGQGTENSGATWVPVPGNLLVTSGVPSYRHGRHSVPSQVRSQTGSTVPPPTQREITVPPGSEAEMGVLPDGDSARQLGCSNVGLDHDPPVFIPHPGRASGPGSLTAQVSARSNPYRSDAAHVIHDLPSGTSWERR